MVIFGLPLSFYQKGGDDKTGCLETLQRGACAVWRAAGIHADSCGQEPPTCNESFLLSCSPEREILERGDVHEVCRGARASTGGYWVELHL